jgi:hypothetical protein
MQLGRFGAGMEGKDLSGSLVPFAEFSPPQV